MGGTSNWRGSARLVLALVPVVLVVTIASAQQQGRGNFGANFTGTIAVQDSSASRVSRIRFEAGARTNWHVHTEGQVILIEEGQGRSREVGGALTPIAAGQPVYLKANVPHWHGAAPEQAALQLSVYAGELKWMEPVTDDEYLGKQKTR